MAWRCGPLACVRMQEFILTCRPSGRAHRRQWTADSRAAAQLPVLGPVAKTPNKHAARLADFCPKSQECLRRRTDRGGLQLPTWEPRVTWRPVPPWARGLASLCRPICPLCAPQIEWNSHGPLAAVVHLHKVSEAVRMAGSSEGSACDCPGRHHRSVHPAPHIRPGLGPWSRGNASPGRARDPHDGRRTVAALHWPAGGAFRR